MLLVGEKQRDTVEDLAEVTQRPHKCDSEASRSMDEVLMLRNDPLITVLHLKRLFFLMLIHQFLVKTENVCCEQFLMRKFKADALPVTSTEAPSVKYIKLMVQNPQNNPIM